MKKEEIPQDNSALKGITTEIAYAVDETGAYTSHKSSGWEVKTEALNIALNDVDEKVQQAKQKVMQEKASPLLYFMEKAIMDVNILAAYTGFWKWTIRRHLKPHVFKKLSEATLKKYAALFEVSEQELKTPFTTDV